MKKYTVTITGKRTEYSTYVFELEAESLKAAKTKAKKLAADDNGDFADDYDEYCDPGDSYEDFKVENVEEIKEN